MALWRSTPVCCFCASKVVTCQPRANWMNQNCVWCGSDMGHSKIAIWVGKTREVNYCMAYAPAVQLDWIGAIFGFSIESMDLWCEHEPVSTLSISFSHLFARSCSLYKSLLFVFLMNHFIKVAEILPSSFYSYLNGSTLGFHQTVLFKIILLANSQVCHNSPVSSSSWPASAGTLENVWLLIILSPVSCFEWSAVFPSFPHLCHPRLWWH